MVRRGPAVLLGGVDFSLSPGERMIIAGPSGAGKTTLLRAIAGLEPLTAGEILIDGRTATSGSEVVIPPHRRGAGMILQDLGLWPALSVAAHLRLAAKNRDEVPALLASLGLTKLARRKPDTLSGGEQQRTALGAALAGSPRMLLLDEPFQGLDAVLRDQLLELVDRHAAALGCGLLCVTHDPLEAARLHPQRILFMEPAAPAADLSWTEALSGPSSAVTPTLCAWRARLHAAPP